MVATQEIEALNHWKIAPNPSAAVIHIKAENPLFECDHIKISSFDGNYQTTLLYEDTINIDFLTNGMYLLHFIYQGKVVGYQKVVKIE